ncbi:transglutaminase-like domain-containing protein [Yinghuangia soli]|uniref:Transglutaminase-like domain-containing protein n=1 Tax=Yinghuangia soli TaxID=2908204 RepID=A0AA41Q799_9ACTN|nr:transglutaminase-like domain-containing protein [Yinghuangia soli]MCF2532250.1 transglutaminase-like domain-containing protein [Yinghuangia soli]
MADDRLDLEFDYARRGPFTALDAMQIRLTAHLPDDPVGICTAAQGLVIQPADAAAQGIPEARIAEKDIRPAADLVAALTALDPSPLHLARTPDKRVVGTCRHFATLACAFLRARGIPARARCGFGMYFLEDHGVDHWITEYRDTESGRWVRVDTEHLGTAYIPRPDDLAADEYLTGGEAWIQYRRGLADGHRFGVAGTAHAWGPARSAATPSGTSPHCASARCCRGTSGAG